MNSPNSQGNEFQGETSGSDRGEKHSKANSLRRQLEKKERECEQLREQLEKQRDRLNDKKRALDELMKQIGETGGDPGSDLRSTIQQDVLPLLRELVKQVEDYNTPIVETVIHELEQESEPLRNMLGPHGAELTSRQTTICNMVRQGMSSKEIAEALDIKPSTVKWHRSQIRDELDLVNEDVTLEAYLRKESRSSERGQS
ncbi:MAG: LuxR C-terminal-related transcriptional regulator [bacterium]